jgi:hypothetical protein
MGLFTKNSSWQAKQSIPHITVGFYDDRMTMCEDFEPNFGNIRTGRWITTTHLLTLTFWQGIFNQQQNDCRPPHTLLS